MNSDSLRKQFDQSVWIVYKFHYKDSLYQLQSIRKPLKNPDVKKINVPFISCEMTFKSFEKTGDSLMFRFEYTYNNKSVSRGLREIDGIPDIGFIGQSDSIRILDYGFYHMYFPQFDESESKDWKEEYEKTNKFVYDTLGDGEFIAYLRAQEKSISPVLKFVCKKKGIL